MKFRLVGQYLLHIQLNIMIICKICKQSFSNRIEIDGKARVLSSRKYCLNCSPFGKHNTKRLDVPSMVDIGKKVCPRCLIEKPSGEYYLRRNGKDFSTYCRTCSLDEVRERQFKFKKQCLEYKGGKCEKCNYNKCEGALEFHHIDPTKKDFSIAHVHLTNFSEKIKHELDKCSLLCANCHREEHARIVKMDII